MLQIKIKQNKIKTILLALFFVLAPFTPITALKAAAQTSPIGTATVTAQGGFSLNAGDVLTLTAQIVGCSSNLPLYNGVPVSITPNQTPQAPFTADSSQSVTFVLPGNDKLLCGGQNYSQYAVTWKVNGFPVAPTKTYRFADNITQNLNTLTPIGWVPPVITNTAGINCPSGTSLNGFDVNYQPHCGPVVTTPMPFSSNPGVILTNPVSGNNYQAQPGVFFSQQGDTLASIESACSVTPCTYVVTQPQIITLAANHTIPATVAVQFWGSASWTVNGSFTLTFTNQVQGSLSQHFAGSSTIKFGSSQALVPVEWFGAIAGDGTDDGAKIQLALNSLTAGQIQLQIGTYRHSVPLSITRSAIGIKGAGMRVTNNTLYVNPNASILLNTSNSADSIDVVGSAPSTYVGFGKFEDFNIERSVLPSGTAAGLSLNDTYGVMVARVGCQDSIRCLYVHGTGAQGNGYVEDFVASWGYNGVTETTGSLYGIYLDSADGLQSPSFRVRNSAVFTALSGPTTYGAAFIGSALNDQMFSGFETAGVSYGQYLQQTGTPGVIGSSDIHFTGGISDGCRISCYFITGLTSGAGAGVEINGGYLTTLTLGQPHIDIQSSYGVRVRGVQFGVAAGGVNTCVNVNSSSNISLVGNLCNGVKNAGFLLSNSTGVTVTGNVLSGVADANGLILLQNSSFNSITSNVLTGTGASFVVDAASNNNTGFPTNSIATTLSGISIAGSNPFTIGGEHLGGDNSAVTATVGSGAGTGGSCSVVGNDTRGTVTIHVGSSPLSVNQNLCTINFVKAYPAAPTAVLSYGPGSGLTSSSATLYAAATTSAFQVNAQSGVAASTTMVLNYVVMQ